MLSFLLINGHYSKQRIDTWAPQYDSAKDVLLTRCKAGKRLVERNRGLCMVLKSQQRRQSYHELGWCESSFAFNIQQWICSRKNNLHSIFAIIGSAPSTPVYFEITFTLQQYDQHSTVPGFLFCGIFYLLTIKSPSPVTRWSFLPTTTTTATQTPDKYAAAGWISLLWIWPTIRWLPQAENVQECYRRRPGSP